MAVSAATLIAEILAEFNSGTLGTGLLSIELVATTAADGTMTTKGKPKIGAMPLDSSLAKLIATTVGTVMSKYIP